MYTNLLSDGVYGLQYRDGQHEGEHAGVNEADVGEAVNLERVRDDASHVLGSHGSGTEIVSS